MMIVKNMVIKKMIIKNVGPGNLLVKSMFTSCLAIILLVLSFIVIKPVTVCAETIDKVKIPWGNGIGKLSLIPKNSNSEHTFLSPSSIVYKKENFYVLDAAEPSIEIFSLDGVSLNYFKLPEKNERTLSPSYSDMVVSSSRAIYVLEAKAGKVLKINGESEKLTSLSIPGRKHVTGYTTLSLSKGILSVFDCFSGEIIRFTVNGDYVGSYKSMLFQNLIGDGRGSFYGATIRGGKFPKTKELTVFKLHTNKEEKMLFGKYEANSEINYYEVVGTDSSNRVYVIVGLGDADITSKVLLIVFNGEGKITRTFKMPQLSSNVTMTRSKIVSSKGKIIVASPKKSGLQIAILNF